jgi:multidrug efflux pump subunit AcrA (membrane-fusion protein)
MKKSVIILIVSYFLIGCGGSKPIEKTAIKTVSVKKTAVHKILYFNGVLQPLHESTITSPADAVVESVGFHYGQHIKQGDIVFTLNSSALQQQYNDTLTEYLKAKDNYAISKARFTGTEDLWDSGLISKNNYLSEKSSLNTIRITLVQSTQKLTDMLDKMGDVSDDITANLSLAEFDKVRMALTSQHNLIRLKANHHGVLLYPPKAAGDNSNKISVGSTVKSGEVLSLIGDMSGVSVEIDVPEVDIAEIKVGMPAIVRGIALGSRPLVGKVVAVNAQASTNNTGTLPSFTANVEVNHLDAMVRPLIKVGMSATVELAVDSQDKLLVPISAIRQNHGKNVVKIQTSPNKFRLQPVITGPVQEDQVIIESGLNPGDVVMLCP